MLSIRPQLRTPEIRWSGLIDQPTNLPDILGQIASFAEELGYKTTRIARWGASDFDIEGMMNDPFDAKRACRRFLDAGLPWDIPPIDAISLSITGNSVFHAINITFARYPETLTYTDTSKEKRTYRTNLKSDYHLKGEASVFPATSLGIGALEDAHKSLTKVIRKLENSNAEVTMSDTTGYERHENADRLHLKMRSYLARTAVDARRMLNEQQLISRDEVAARYPVLTLPDFESYERAGERLIVDESDNQAQDQR